MRKNSMKKNHVVLWLAIICMTLVLAGCSKDAVTDPGTAAHTDAQAMKYLVESGDSVSAFSASDEFSIDDEGMRSSDYDDLAKIGFDREVLRSVSADSIYPIKWGRRIFWNQVVRNYNVTVTGDTLALVEVTKTLPGEFWVGLGTRSSDTVIIDTVIKKPFTDVSKRNLLFKRIARHEDSFRNWVPVAITMVAGKSQGTNQFSITSIEMKETRFNVDTTITNPLNTWFRLGWQHGTVPVFPVHDSVTVLVTVTSADDSAEIVHLRHGIGGDGHNRRRTHMALISTTGGAGNYTRVYEKTFVTGLRPFIFAERCNAVVDVISHGTIYDNAAPFSNEYWGLSYIIGRF